MKTLTSLLLSLALVSCSSGSPENTSNNGTNNSATTTYRLTTSFTGPTKLLGIEPNTNNILIPALVDIELEATNTWALVPSQQGGSQSFLYRIQSSQSDSPLFLNIEQNNGIAEVGLTEDNSSTSSLWAIIPRDNGYCRITPFSLGEGNSLDIVNDDDDRMLKLATSGNFSGQSWLFDLATGQANEHTPNECLNINRPNPETNNITFLPTSAYRQTDMAGFNVLINPDADALGQLGSDALTELENQLSTIESNLPVQVLNQLQQVPIWVEANQLPDRSGQFHVSEAWLSSNGYNPEKVGAVEISNARVFLEDAALLSVSTVLHELAHARQFYLDDNDSALPFEMVYQQALTSGEYESVAYATGTTRRAYALTNNREYFAELSEAYLGTNDFYPFVRSELLAHDPAGYELVRAAWR